jgi:cell division protein FtsI (penicillin-binding protein 3)
MTQTSLNRIWVVLFGLVLYGLLLAYGAYTIVLAVPPPTASRAPTGPVTPPLRGSLYAADGTPLAFSTADRQRIYPLGSLAGQLVGFGIVSVGNDQGQGLEGLEGSLNPKLSQGQNLTLTIDPRIQAIAEQALWDGIERSGSEWGTALVMDPPTGQLLAVANGPTFDPGDVGQRGQGVRWRNHAFVVALEPGSTVKVLTAAALMNEGLANLNSPVQAPMSRKIDRWTINDVVAHPSSLTLKSVLGYSSNVGISLLAERMTPSTLYGYFTRLHFTEKVRLPGIWSAQPQVRQPTAWGSAEFANASYGQGFLVTPLHLTAAFNTLGNQGRYVAPQLFAQTTPAPPEPVFSPEVTQQILTALEENNVSEARLPGYSLGGKTGTAQVVISQQYSRDIYTALYAGFVPAQKPRVTVVVALYHPKGRIHGSQVAAPVYRAIAEQLFTLWGMPPGQKPLE